MPLYHDVISEYVLIDYERRRYWFDFSLLPPAGGARLAKIAELRSFVTNQMHDWGCFFGSDPPLDEIEPDEKGWRTLPESE